ncbi:MAG: MarR family transcriptional regulator [Blautia sp.]|nr:MarR family transcriptional regulator [Blautia sp.]
MENNIDQYREYGALLDQYDKELDDIYHYYALRHDLSDAALWILYAVHGSDAGVTQADICNGWFFSRQTINTALKGLAQQGVIKLEAVPGNRKSKHVVFTPQGRQLAQRIVVPLKQAENQVFASFTDEENRLFVEMAGKRCSLLRKFLETK